MTDVQLPLFPLPIVLFPGTPQALHVFEPRYRQLLEDCLAGDRRFGLSYLAERHDRPESGDLGCRCVIREHHTLPDGRSNVLAVGETRYLFRETVESDRLYAVGRVELFHDRDEDSAHLDALAARVREDTRDLVQKLRGPEEVLPATVPDFPDEPEQLSYHTALALQLDLATKEALARLTSTADRLNRLLELLGTLRADAKRRQEGMRVAKRNGRHIPGSKPPA